MFFAVFFPYRHRFWVYWISLDFQGTLKGLLCGTSRKTSATFASLRPWRCVGTVTATTGLQGKTRQKWLMRFRHFCIFWNKRMQKRGLKSPGNNFGPLLVQWLLVFLLVEKLKTSIYMIFGFVDLSGLSCMDLNMPNYFWKHKRFDGIISENIFMDLKAMDFRNSIF